MGFPHNAGILGVVQPPLSEAEAGDKTEVEVLPDLQVSDHIEVKAGPVEALYPNDGVGKNELFTPVRGVAARVEAQREAEIKRLVLEIVEVVVVAACKLGAAAGAKENG